MYSDDFDLMQLFFTKIVTIYKDNKELFKIKVPTIKDLYEQDFCIGFSIINVKIEELNSKYNWNLKSNLDYLSLLFFNFGMYKEYKDINNGLTSFMKKIFLNFEIDYSKHKFKVNNIELNNEIWDYVVYVLKYSCGEKIEIPKVFKTEMEKEWFLAQQKYEAKIKKIKEENKVVNKNALLETILLIIYAFPSLTMEFLFQQTVAQIHWLQEKAAASVSYSVNEKIYAAGNMKNGYKLEFFLK